VDVFFVLSGFLITSLLIREFEARRSVSFKAFYMRRALRLLPAFYVVFVFAIILAETITPKGVATPTLSGLPWVFFYVGNLRASYGHANLGLLNPTWSLAEEEQFYLVWPAICVLILTHTSRRIRPALVLLGLALIEMVYRAVLVDHGASLLSRIVYGPDTRSDGLLLGCALAFVLTSQRYTQLATRLRANAVAAAGGVCGVLLACLAAFAPMMQASGFEYAIPLTVVASGGLIWSLITAPVGPLHWLLASRPAVWLGRRSYGLYLWHFPIILGVPLSRSLPHAVRLPMHVGLSIGAAALSYRFLEMPFLRLKRRWQTDLAPASA
jgi:peptidoglycan/LPS O-acetylase OafA/YrhL